MTAFFLSIYTFFSNRRGLVYSLLLLLVLLFVFSAYQLRFKEDISRFLPENKQNEQLNKAYQYISATNTITIYCTPDTAPLPPLKGAGGCQIPPLKGNGVTPPLKGAGGCYGGCEIPPLKGAGGCEIPPLKGAGGCYGGCQIPPLKGAGGCYGGCYEGCPIIAAIDALAEQLLTQSISSDIKNIFHRIDPMEMIEISSFITDNMIYFLSDDDYNRMDSLLTREAIQRRVMNNKNALSSLGGVLMRSQILKDPLQLSGRLMQQLQRFKVSDRLQLIDDHLFNDDHQAVMFVECAIPVSDTKNNARFIDSLKRLMKEIEGEFPGIHLESFGAAEIGLTNARQIQKDTLFSMSFAVFIIFALLIYAFRSGRKILLIFSSVLFGGLFAFALLNLISNEVSIIAIGISSMMFGIAINYPLHFMQRYSHAPNPRIVMRDIVEPLTIGNMTTVGAFFSLVFIGSDAMRDLGLFAALLLIGTILFVLLFLPHFLPSTLSDHNDTVYDAYPTDDKSVLGKLINRPFEKNKTVVLVIILLTVFFSFFSGGVRFESNMHKINYMTDSQKKSFDKMTALMNDNRHIMYMVTEGKDLETTLEANEKQMGFVRLLENEGEIDRVSGIGSFFPSRARQSAQIKRWSDFWRTRRDRVIHDLKAESLNVGFNESACQSFVEMLDRSWETVDVSHFNPIREKLAKNHLIENEDGVAVIQYLYMDANKAPAIEKRLNSEMIQSPGVFSIAFDAGTITRRLVSSLSDQFDKVLYICGILVFAFLLFSFGRIELALIAFLPLALSWLWILGLMHLFDIRFNIVNIILATFIFGQGDDYTILMTEGMMHEYAYRRKILFSYKKSIMISALVMFTGMGLLIFAQHPALRSLAEVTMVGMLTVVIMAYVFPSLLFRLLTMQKGKKRRMPVTLINLLGLIYAFVVFLIGSFIITCTGWLLFAFGRITERKKLFYHKLLCWIAKFVIFRVPQVKTTFRNLSGETFDKPGVIICNHQSHLDLMCVMMLTPKLIILTNDRVWKSPFYGRLIRYADYYPVSNGIENATDQLQNAINRGYSIVVFPEGTRSPDCAIKRFHRGAFYLAEQLNVDLIPVMIHGVGHVLPKEEFMLRKGRITIQVMPRITPDDSRFSSGYSPRSREVRHYYQAEYQNMCDEIETPAYYADLVLKNYIYKGSAIAHDVRRNLKKHNNFNTEIAAMPDEGEVTIHNTGYGEYALLLSLVKKHLSVTAIEPDPDRRALAENCASIPNNLKFVT